MLRIDTHTALETRGRYARLCIQIDVNKPPIDTILIGRFEQPVIYEGIQKLCFSCGRIGHKKEACPFTIRSPAEGKPVSAEVGDGLTQTANSCEVHDTHSTTTTSGTTEDTGAGIENERYGPWMLVECRKPGQRKTKNFGSPGGHTNVGLGPLKHDYRAGPASGLIDWAEGWGSKVVTEGQERGVTNEPIKLGREVSIKERSSVRPINRSNASVRGKKELARNRVNKWYTKEAAGNSRNISLNTSVQWSSLSKISEGDCSHSHFQFIALDQADEGIQAWRQDEGDKSEEHMCAGMVRQEGEAELGAHNHGVDDQSKEGTLKLHGASKGVDASTLSRDQIPSLGEGMEVGSYPVHKKGEDSIGASGDGMECEEGSEATAPF